MKLNEIKDFFKIILDFLFPSNHSINEIFYGSPDNLKLILPQASKLPENMTALFAYSNEQVKYLIWEIKYYKNKKVAYWIGMLLAEKIKFELKHLNQPILLMPIPMTPKRSRQRGFDHTQFLCHAIKQFLPNNFIMEINVLKKIKNTPNQSSLENRTDRLENLRNCFAVVNQEIIRSQTIILIDDVITTGATMREAKKILLQSGAKEVFCFAVGH